MPISRARAPTLAYIVFIAANAAPRLMISARAEPRIWIGAAVLVSGALAAVDRALERLRRVPGIEQVTLSVVTKNTVARELYTQSGLGPKDFQTAVVYDHFTPFVLAQLEAFGFCGRGEAKDFIRDGRIEMLTEDHSLLNDYIKMKRLTPEEIANFPHKNVITRALGIRETVQVDVKRFGIEPGIAEFLPYPPQVAGEKLLEGQIQAAMIVASWESPVFRRLLASDYVELASFARADALVALYPYLTRLVVPAGVADMGRNRPPADVVVLAPETSLLVRRELHPAIQYLLLDAATEVHSTPGIFRKAGQFPAAESVDVPLSESAHVTVSGELSVTFTVPDV